MIQETLKRVTNKGNIKETETYLFSSFESQFELEKWILSKVSLDQINSLALTKEDKDNYNRLWEIQREIAKLPRNKAFADKKNLISLDVSSDKRKSTGTKAFKEAFEMLQNGWMPENNKHLFDKLSSKLKTIKPKKARQTYKDFAGPEVDIAEYLTGSPLCYTNEKHTSRQKRTRKFKLGIDIGCGYDTSSAEIKKAGAVLFQIIKHFEAIAPNVSTYVLDCGAVKNLGYASIKNGRQTIRETLYFEMKLKDYTQPFNFKKLCYPIMHSSFLRRILFFLTEQAPLQEKLWSKNYGTVIKLSSFHFSRLNLLMMRNNKDTILGDFKTIVEEGFEKPLYTFNQAFERFPERMEKPDIILPVYFIVLADKCLKQLSRYNDEEREDIIVKAFVDALQKYLNK